MAILEATDNHVGFLLEVIARIGFIGVLPLIVFLFPFDLLGVRKFELIVIIIK